MRIRWVFSSRKIVEVEYEHKIKEGFNGDILETNILNLGLKKKTREDLALVH
jgi:hypothetical protein